MDDTNALKQKLSALKVEHRQLDEKIAGLMDFGPYNQLEVQRLKRRKLALKDEIIRIDNRLLPDIIA